MAQTSPSNAAQNTEQISYTGSISTPKNLKKGKCKWFHIKKGWGFITPQNGGQDVFVHQSVLHMPGFRSLAEDEAVEFECVESEKGIEATYVTGPELANLKGSRFHLNNRKRFRKTRCYNCGEFANHLAADCSQEPQAKKCHYCKSSGHLVANCPTKTTEKTSASQLKSPQEGDSENSVETNPS